MDEFSLDLTGGGGAAPSSWSASGPFERNLRALERRSPSAAAAIRAALPSVDLEFVETPEGEFGLRAIGASGRRTLASARAPLAEGRRLAETIDPLESGCVCVVGFGAGHHCRAMVERFGVESVVACFEPDVGLLRAVFERIDHSRWIESGLFILVTNADDGPALGRGLAGLEPLPMLGTRIVEHPASRERIGEASTAFGLTVMRVMKTTRAAVATALVHSRSTVRNLFMNIDRYATEPGVLDLAGIASGRPAIVVSAGPSLARSLPTLKRAEVRERFIVIGATTVLKTLLAEGIRPDFVCALDHHDLSRRFIEGLTAADVEGVTLVVEPKVNASVVDLYPGAIRMTQEDRLDDLLGGLKRPMGTIPAGATVAHLSYFLARWLGCDPVALVGQDLGFTDGQYYAGGAAIHEVWGGELNAFNTLEMMEWQRIVRQGGNLVRTVDHLGRPMFTDEQMAAYLQQFEAAFERDTAAGRRVIDATEGGAKKRFTEPMTLEGFVEAFGTAPKPELPAAIRLGDAGSRVGRLSAMLTGMSADAKTIAAQSRRSASMLGELAEALGDGPRFNRKVDELHVVRDEVEALEPAYGLVQHINQAGQLKRLKADRAIRLERESLDELGTRRRQIERDATNVSWLAEAADEVVTLIEQTRAAIEGRGPRLTRDHDVMISQALDVDGPQADPASVGEATSIREVVRAVVFAHDTVGGLGQARDLGAEVWNGRNALRLTVERLLFASELDGVTVVAGDVERARRLVGDAFDNDRVRVVGADAARLDRRTRRVGVGRLWSASSWRGGLSGLSCYDEGLDARELARVMDEDGIDAAVVVGADWALVDPALVDEVAACFRSAPGHVKLSFTQAPPGLGGFLIQRDAARDAASAVAIAGGFASIGGLIGYVPMAPQSDPITRDFCRRIDPVVRDCGMRFVCDGERSRGWLGRVMGRLGGSAETAGASEIVTAARSVGGRWPGVVELVLETNTGRLGGGVWSRWRQEAGGVDHAHERPVMGVDAARGVIEQAVEAHGLVALTLDGAGDPLLHPELGAIIEASRAAGVAGVHVRTDGLAPSFDADRILEMGADVVSVDVLAATAKTHAALTGTDRFGAIVEAMDSAGRRAREASGEDGLGDPWLVARMTRCDEVYEEVETFYERWLLMIGAAVIDALPRAVEGARIAPLPEPRSVVARRASERVVVRSDGTVVGDGRPRRSTNARAMGRAERLSAA